MREFDVDWYLGPEDHADWTAAVGRGVSSLFSVAMKGACGTIPPALTYNSREPRWNATALPYRGPHGVLPSMSSRVRSAASYLVYADVRNSR